MVKKVLLGLLGLVGVFVLVVLALAATKPDRFEASRSREIAAPRSAVAPLVADLRSWERWSPWSDLDPDQTLTYGDTTTGPGAWYAWEGNDQVGRGRMEIAAVDEGADRTAIDYRIHFIEPFESQGDVRMELADTAGGGTNVTWSMASDQSFMEKIMCVFIDMDAMIGRDFERGLERIDRLARAAR